MPTETLTFFNRISQEYDGMITRSVPRYQEMFWAMLYYLPPSFLPAGILELGCGTGNLTRQLHERWPQSPITVVDFSPEMLEITSQKLNTPLLTPVESAFESLDLPEGQFDLVISSIAVHHLSDPEKARLFHRIYTWLRPGGFFVLGDQVMGANQRLHQADLLHYEAYARSYGATESDIQNWREHRQTQDHYATIADLTTWMNEAGFQCVDIVWRYCFWTVFQGQKPPVSP